MLRCCFYSLVITYIIWSISLLSLIVSSSLSSVYTPHSDIAARVREEEQALAQPSALLPLPAHGNAPLPAHGYPAENAPQDGYTLGYVTYSS